MRDQDDILLTLAKRIRGLETEVARLSTLEFVQSRHSTIASSRAISAFLGLPLLKVYYPMTVHTNGNDIADLVGVRHLGTLSSGARLTTTLDVVSALWLAVSSSGYASATNHSTFNITGTEAHVAAADRGLTIGCWYRSHTALVNSGLAGIYDDAGNRKQYLLWTAATTGLIKFNVSVDGSADTSVSSPKTTVLNEWNLVIGRFDPGTSLKLFHNGQENTNTTSIPASLYTGTAPFEVGRYQGASSYFYSNSFMANVFLCAGTISDATVDNLWQTTRGLYGV